MVCNSSVLKVILFYPIFYSNPGEVSIQAGILIWTFRDFFCGDGAAGLSLRRPGGSFEKPPPGPP